LEVIYDHGEVMLNMKPKKKVFIFYFIFNSKLINAITMKYLKKIRLPSKTPQYYNIYSSSIYYILLPAVHFEFQLL